MQARGRRTRPEGEHRGRDGRVRYAARRRRDSGYRQRRAGRLARSLSGGRIETSDRHAPVLLLGSGLTAVDALLALRHHWHCGKVYMVSRRGLLPQTPVLPVDSIRPETNRDRQALSFAEQRRFLRHLRPLWDTHSHRMAPQIGTVVHGSLRDGSQTHVLPVDSIRPETNRDWQALSFAEQRRLLRHLRPLWDTHSHRMAPQIGTVAHGAHRCGSLELLAGRTYGLRLVQDGVEVSIAIRGRTEIKTLKVERVVNCTGPETDLSRSTNPVLRNLVEQGWLQPDPQGLGALATI